MFLIINSIGLGRHRRCSQFLVVSTTIYTRHRLSILGQEGMYPVRMAEWKANKRSAADGIREWSLEILTPCFFGVSRPWRSDSRPREEFLLVAGEFSTAPRLEVMFGYLCGQHRSSDFTTMQNLSLQSERRQETHQWHAAEPHPQQ